MTFNDRFYEFFKRIWKFEKKQKLVEIDFEKPWWHMVKPYAKKYLLIVFSGFVEIAFLTLLPIVFTKIIQDGDYNLLALTTAINPNITGYISKVKIASISIMAPAPRSTLEMI